MARLNISVIWDLEDDEHGNYVHIVIEHGVGQDEIDDVLCNPRNEVVPSDSSGYPGTFGWTRLGRHIYVVWELVEDDPRSVRPITAYETPLRRRRKP